MGTPTMPYSRSSPTHYHPAMRSQSPVRELDYIRTSQGYPSPDRFMQEKITMGIQSATEKELRVREKLARDLQIENKRLKDEISERDASEEKLKATRLENERLEEEASQALQAVQQAEQENIIAIERMEVERLKMEGERLRLERV